MAAHLNKNGGLLFKNYAACFQRGARGWSQKEGKATSQESKTQLEGLCGL